MGRGHNFSEFCLLTLNQAVFRKQDLSEKMCINHPKKSCKSNGQCGGLCDADVVKSVRMVFDNIQWFKAVDYADLLRMLQQYSGKKIRLLGANTGTGKCQSNMIIRAIQ